MDTTKPAIKSIGIMAPVAALLVMILNQFVFKGNVISDADVTSAINEVATVVGLVGGIYGRWKATQQVSLTGK